MDAHAAQLIESFDATGPVTYKESEALLELFQRRGDRLDTRTKIRICEMIKAPYHEKLNALAAHVNALEDTVTSFVCADVHLPPAQRAQVETLIRQADTILELITSLF